MTRLVKPDELASYRAQIATEYDACGSLVLVCGGTGCRAGRGLPVADAFSSVFESKGLFQEPSETCIGCQACDQPFASVKELEFIRTKLPEHVAGEAICPSCRRQQTVNLLSEVSGPCSPQQNPMTEAALKLYTNSQGDTCYVA